MRPNVFAIFLDGITGDRKSANSQEEAEVFLQSIQPKDYYRYFVWMPTWTEWKNMQQMYNSLGKPDSTQTGITRSRISVNNNDSQKDFSGDHFNWSVKTTTVTEARRFPRYEARLEFMLVSKTDTFKSFSRNISLSGALLEDPIPKKFLMDWFELHIQKPNSKNPQKEKMIFRGRVVGDLKDPYRLTFLDPDPDQQERLKKLIGS